MTGLAEALAKVQANLPHIHKGKEAKVPGKEGRAGYSYKYADLSDVAAAIHPLLAAEGLAWVTKPTLTDDGRFVLAYTLVHGESGQAEEGIYPLPDPLRSTPQQIGSAITYARRYCLSSVTGVVPDEDDDAQAANDTKASARRPKTAAQQEHAAVTRDLTKGQPRAERGPLPPEQDQWSTEGPRERKTDSPWMEGWRIAVLSAEAPEALDALESQLRRAWDEHRLTLPDKDDLKALLTEKRSDLAEVTAAWPVARKPGDAA